MVEAEVIKAEPKTGKESVTSIDLNEIIEKVRDLIGNFKEMSGKPMNVKVDSFNFTFSKASEGEYGLNVDTKIVITPKNT